jgi:hypothetical protein
MTILFSIDAIGIEKEKVRERINRILSSCSDSLVAVPLDLWNKRPNLFKSILGPLRVTILS